MSRATTVNLPPAPRTKFDEVRDRADLDQFMVYAVSNGAAIASTGMLMGDPLNTSVKLLTRETGGGFHEFETTKDAAEAMVEVAKELHHQYLLGFEPVSADGKLHHLDVRIKRPGVSATARQSYMAAKK